MDSRYGLLASARLQGLASARAFFVMRSIGDFLLILAEGVAPLLLVARFGSIAGWSGPEVAMLVGLGRAGEGLALTVGRGVDPFVFSDTVRLGRFDQILIRPVSPIGWLLTSEIELRFIFRTLAGLAIVAWCANQAGVSVGPAELGLFVLSVVCSAVFVLSALILGAALTFRVIEGSEVTSIFANGGISLASFPLDLYASALRFIFTFIVPVGLFVYVPVVTVLGRDGPGPLGPQLLPLIPFVVATVVALSALGWRAGVRRYQSTGS